ATPDLIPPRTPIHKRRNTHMTQRNIRLLAVAASAALVLSACGSGDDDTAAAGTDRADRTSAEGMDELRIGIKAAQPGLGLREGSEYTGFDVEIAKGVAAQLGVDEGNITWVEAPSAQRETRLETDQVDLIVA